MITYVYRIHHMLLLFKSCFIVYLPCHDRIKNTLTCVVLFVYVQYMYSNTLFHELGLKL